MTEQRTREVGMWMEANLLALEMNASHAAERLHVERVVRAREIRPAGSQALLHGSQRNPQHLGNGPSVGGGINQLIGSNAEVVDLLGECESRSFPVEQRSAPRRQLDTLGPLRRRYRRMVGTLQQLDVRRPTNQGNKPHCEHGLDELKPSKRPSHALVPLLRRRLEDHDFAVRGLPHAQRLGPRNQHGSALCLPNPRKEIRTLSFIDGRLGSELVEPARH
jgi:hypothetical protein